jgi:hypothetical protein
MLLFFRISLLLSKENIQKQFLRIKISNLRKPLQWNCQTQNMHAFCIWHIVAKLSSWFSFALSSRYNDFKQDFHRVYHLACEEYFEQEWHLMVAKFGWCMDRHINLLFSHRKCWALAYLKDFFLLG